MADVFLWDHVIHAPLTNAAALAALDVTSYVNGVVANVIQVGVFVYDNASAATADNLTVIAPSAGPGRWLNVKQNLSISNAILGTTGSAGQSLEIPFTSLARTIAAETTGAGVRADISAAASGTNSDITSLSALSSPFMVPQITGPNAIFTGASNVYKEYTANSGAAITIDPANGPFQTITLTANTTITIAAVPAVATEVEFTLKLLQDGTGSRTVTWANITFATNNGAAPAINTPIGSSTYIGIAGTNAAWIGYPVNQGIGVTNGSSASAGYIGEVLQSIVASGSAVSLTTATVTVITSVAYTAGDWMVSCNPTFIGTAVTSTELQAFLSTASGTSTTGQTTDNTGFGTPFVVGATAQDTVPLSYRFLTSSSGTLYLKGKATFSVGTVTGYGSLTMRRVR